MSLAAEISARYSRSLEMANWAREEAIGAIMLMIRMKTKPTGLRSSLLLRRLP